MECNYVYPIVIKEYIFYQITLYRHMNNMKLKQTGLDQNYCLFLTFTKQ